jgi:Holliday junction resolvase
MKQRARVDKNHPELVACLRKLGCSVLSLATVGKGCPDLLISYQKQCYLVEVKSEHGKLNTWQEEWGRRWGSPVYVVKTKEDCVALLIKLRRHCE